MKKKKDPNHIDEFDTAELLEGKRYVLVRGERMSLGAVSGPAKCEPPIRVSESAWDNCRNEIDAFTCLSSAAETLLRTTNKQCAEMLKKSKEMQSKFWARMSKRYGLDPNIGHQIHHEHGDIIIRAIEPEPDEPDIPDPNEAEEK